MPKFVAELSRRNPYHLSKYRSLELKYACLQFPEWKREYCDISVYKAQALSLEYVYINDISDPTARAAIRKAELSKKIDIVKKTAEDTDPDLSKYILLNVTEDRSYGYLQTVKEIPCSRNTFYSRVRKFYWLLDKRW